jgi:prepilin-type N-terminal cleavage/methylation domain-containing protein/prepilin-type processing-associated H-X9-DG protein
MVLQNRKAFTLVELLVVVVIIGMLMALLLPAVLGARGRARQLQCTNNQQELGKALLQYEAAKGYLPGYVNSFGTSGNTANLSWVIMVFQYLGEGDLWKTWRDPNVTLADKMNEADVNFAAVTLPGLKCPADDPSEKAPLSYVVNCGLSDYGLRATPADANTDDVLALEALFAAAPDPATKAANAVQDPAYGLFFDHTLLPATARTRVILDKITDGAQHTIMLSENIQASQWAPWPPRLPQQLDVGILWWSEEPPSSAVVAGDGRLVNDGLEKELIWPGDYTGAPSLGRYFARPSSAHSGGVVMTFADGHSEFKSEDMEYSIYQSLMTPEDSKAKKQGLVSP